MGSAPEVKHFAEGDTVPFWINGKQVAGSQTFDITSPLTDKKLYKSAAATQDDVHAAVAAAEKAAPAWAETKATHRRDLLLKAAIELERRKDSMFHYCNTETASSEAYFAFDFADAVESLRSSAGLIHSVLQGAAPEMSQPGRTAIVVQEPYGVVLAIAPWNCPTILGLRSFLGPIAMGNTVVLKGSEKSPACIWLLADIFHAVGFPPGVLNTLIHRPEDGQQIIPMLIKAPAVKKINFTGSTAVGSIIAKLAGEELKPVLLELGGKAPAIVCEDADLQLAAFQCALGAFLHAGQICMSTERILVHEKIVSEFREALKGAIEMIFPASGDNSILIDKAPVSKNKTLLEDALGKGAQTLVGDIKSQYSLSTAMRPIVIEGIKPDMDLYYKESFGPTVALFVVKDDEAAVQIANDTEYGLTSAVFTQDLRRGIKIAKRIETGAVHINSMSVHDEPALPHGGAKKSGYGRFNAAEGLKEWIRSKTITWMD